MKKILIFLLFSFFICLPYVSEADEAGKLFDSAYKHYIKREFDDALSKFSELIDNEHESPQPRFMKIAMFHKSRGSCFKQLRMYARAINEYQLALELYAKQKKQAQISNCLIQLAELYSLIGKPEQSIIFFEEALTNVSDLGWLSKIEEINFQLGKVSYNQGYYSHAENYFLKSLHVKRDSGYSYDETYLFAETNYFLARIAYLQNMPAKSLSRINNAEDFCIQNMDQLVGLKRTFFNLNILRAKVFSKQGERNLFAGQVKKCTSIAEKYKLSEDKLKLDLLLVQFYDREMEFEKAEKILSNYFIRFNTDDNPMDFELAPNYLEFVQQACIHYQNIYQQKRDTVMLKKCYEFAKSKLALLGLKPYSTPFLKDLNYFNTQFKPLFDVLIKSAIELYYQTNEMNYLTEAIEITEQYKITELYESDNWLIKHSTDLAENEQVELAMIAYHINELLANKNSLNEDGQASVGGQDLIGLLNTYEKSYSGIQKRFNIKEQHPFTESQIVKNLQSKLAGNVAYFKMYHSEEELFMFLITNDNIHIKNLKLSHEFAHHLREYTSFILNDNIENITLNELNRYFESAHYLYKRIFKPFGKLIANNTVIIENIRLFKNITFDALLTNEVKQEGMNMKGLPFFIKSNNLVYSISVTEFLEQSLKNARQISGYVGLAPFSDSPELMMDNSLVHSGTEIKKAAELFDGDVFLGDKASKTELLKYASNKSIIHIATHATNHPIYPQLSNLVVANKNNDKDSKLHYFEVLNTKWNSPLLILGACGSSNGDYIENYGTASLANAFQKSGVEAVIGANWKVDDQVSQQIILNTMKSLNDGIEVSEALRNAKLLFLEQSPKVFSHPHFWSVYSYMGAPKIMQADTNKINWMKAFLIMTVLIFIVYFLYKLLSLYKIL